MVLGDPFKATGHVLDWEVEACQCITVCICTWTYSVSSLYGLQTSVRGPRVPLRALISPRERSTRWNWRRWGTSCRPDRDQNPILLGHLADNTSAVYLGESGLNGVHRLGEHEYAIKNMDTRNALAKQPHSQRWGPGGVWLQSSLDVQKMSGERGIKGMP